MKVVPLNAPMANQVKRIGFLAGQIEVPDDFDQMGSGEIEQLFGDEMKLLLDTHLLLWAAGQL